MKITGAWNTFKSNHPKFPAFCQAVSRKGLKEGSIIEIAITTPAVSYTHLTLPTICSV